MILQKEMEITWGLVALPRTYAGAYSLAYVSWYLVYGPVWFRLSENRLSENQDFLIIRCLKNPLSEESGVFGNPDYFYWIVCSDCKMTYLPLSPVSRAMPCDAACVTHETRPDALTACPSPPIFRSTPLLQPSY
jgi:hypothetical protein